jgi:hypothetical protein
VIDPENAPLGCRRFTKKELRIRITLLFHVADAELHLRSQGVFVIDPEHTALNRDRLEEKGVGLFVPILVPEVLRELAHGNQRLTMVVTEETLVRVE